MSGWSWPLREKFYTEEPDEDARFYDRPFDSIPFDLAECPVCSALVDWMNSEQHKDWHLGAGR